jgi:hypothetical protein
MAAGGSCGGEEPFEFDRGQHIRVLYISVLGISTRIKGLKTRGEDNCAYMNREFPLCILEVDGAAGAELLAGLALALLKEDAAARIDGVLQGHGLGVLDVNGLSLIEVLVIGVINLPWALLSAQAAGDALVYIHVAGGLAEGGGEVSLVSLQLGELSEGEQLDVDVPADLDQFG